MIETYYMDTQDWPDTRSGILHLPKPKVEDMNYVVVYKWDFEDLKLTCTANIMDLVSVSEIIDSDGAYKFAGEIYKFEANIDFYRDRFGIILGTGS